MTNADTIDVKPDGMPTWPFLAVVLAIVVGLAIGEAAAFWSANSYIVLLERQYEFYRSKFDYYFGGANKRGYIELCRGADGEVDVLFHDECAP